MTRRLALKIAAVCFSVLMFSGYVYLRAGGGPKMISGSKFPRVATPPATQATILFFQGSKSDQVLPGSKGGVVLLPGSKSFTLTTSAPDSVSSASSQPTIDRVLIYSSKSAPVLLPSEVNANTSTIVPADTLTLKPPLPTPPPDKVVITGVGQIYRGTIHSSTRPSTTQSTPQPAKP
jgi:hypothetical protein